MAWADAAGTTEVKIEAAGNINYDMDTDSTIASGEVILTKEDIIIECQELNYNGKTGEVQAFGDVKITTAKYTYQTKHLNYNLNRKMGDLAEFKGKLSEGSNDYYFTGKDGSINGDTGTISKASMTRCPRPKSDYVLTAKRIDYDNQRVYLHHAILKVKGIPVFYFPRLSFKIDNSDLPDIKLNNDNEEGLQVNFDYAGPIENNRSWHYKGELSTKGSNSIGFGVKYYFDDHFSNRVNLAYDFDDFWVLDNQISYDARLFSLYLDGIMEFSDREEKQLGIRLTRKYWETSIGKWRFGVLARNVYALDSSKQEYGGTYWGDQLDYNPSRYVMFSYLWLDSEKNNEDFRDFLEDYQLGNNYLYNIKIPLSNSFSLGLNGTYNSEASNEWIRRFYGIKYETCCFRLSTGWNDISESWEMEAGIKF